MAANRKPRKAYRPRPVCTNTLQRAMVGAGALSADDVARQTALVRAAIDGLRQGRQPQHHWRSLADTANMAETLAAMRLGGGPQADAVIHAAQVALHDLANRARQRGTWTLYASELEALTWLSQLHTVQLRECSYAEFETAYHRTRNRVQQARAGNAPACAVVVEGLLA